MSGRDGDENGELDDDVSAGAEDSGAEELDGEYAESVEDELEDFEEGDEDLKVVDEALSHKDQSARALAIRRAIEERLEAKRLSKDLDYLDLDLDAED